MTGTASFHAVQHADGLPSKSTTSLVILGADAYLAARPATPVQVDHACRAAGYAAAIPATWGDELLAAACAEQLAIRTQPTAIYCACQRVRDRLLGPGPDLIPFLVSLVAPPVATARYLHRLYGDVPIEITYVGNCPSANADPSITRQLRPEDFFASLEARGIVAAREPLAFNSFFAPDRRRFISLPGGLPIDRVLQEDSGTDFDQPASTTLPRVPRSVVDIRDVEYAAELAQYLISGAPVLLDLGPRLGCACSGAVGGVAASGARSAVMALEPPRSPGPVVETDLDIDLDMESRIDEMTEPLVDVVTALRTAAQRSPAPADREVEWRQGLGGEGEPAQPPTPPTTPPPPWVAAPATPPSDPPSAWSASWLASCALAGPYQTGSGFSASAKEPLRQSAMVPGPDRSARVP